MSYTYQNFASLPVNLNRQAYGALDISQVFTSIDDLKYYVSKGSYVTNVSTYWYESEDKKVVPYPYAGQYIALVDNTTRKVTAYILQENEEGAEFAFSYKEVGITPIGDDKTVTVDSAGKISLHGIDGKTSGTFVPKLKDGTLVWETPSAITVEGLQDRIGDLEDAKAELEAKDELLQGEIDAVEVTVGQHTTKLGQLEAADTATNERIDGHAGRLDSIEATLNGTGEGEEHVAGLVEIVNSNTARIGEVEADLTNVYTRTEADEKIAQEIGKQAHFSAKVVTDKSEMTDNTVLYLFKPEGATGTDAYEQYIVIDGVATLIGETSVDLRDYAKTSDVNAVKAAIEAAYQAADEALGARIDGVNTAIGNLGNTYAKIEDVNKKADKTALDATDLTVADHTRQIAELEAAKHTHSNADVLAAITSEKVAKWDSAESNVVKSVNENELVVSEAGELSIKAVAQEKVTGLAGALSAIQADVDSKVSAQEGYGLISNNDLAKLSKLSSDGTLAAENVSGLATWVADNRETVAGLMSADEETKLANIDAGAQVNVIEGVTVGGVQLSPSATKIVDIPFASNTAYGVVKGAAAENMVSINSDQQMEVHSLNVSKLVQDEGSVLILNGGNA